MIEIFLKKEFGFKLIIAGGAEAYIVASMLASENVSVILSPYMVSPSTFETWRATLNSALTLYQNNVNFAIATNDPGNVRELRWYAGVAAGTGLPWMEALKAITINPAKFFGIDSQGIGSITVGTPANFVAMDSLDALSLDAYIDLVAVKQQVNCKPIHY